MSDYNMEQIFCLGKDIYVSFLAFRKFDIICVA